MKESLAEDGMSQRANGPRACAFVFMGQGYILIVNTRTRVKDTRQTDELDYGVH